MPVPGKQSVRVADIADIRLSRDESEGRRSVCRLGFTVCKVLAIWYTLAKRMKSARLKPRFTFWRLRVGHSPIQGQGVFGDEGMPGGQRVIEYTGERISHCEAVKRFEKISESRNKRICHFF